MNTPPKSLVNKYVKIFKPFYRGKIVRLNLSGTIFKCLTYCNVDYQCFDFYIDSIVDIVPKNRLNKILLNQIKKLEIDPYNKFFEELMEVFKFREIDKVLCLAMEEMKQLENTYPNILKEHIFPQLGK